MVVQYLKIIAGAHLAINISPLPCLCAMYPLNWLTGVYPANEGGGFTINGRLEWEPITPFENIVSSQGSWLFGLMGLGFPHPLFYFGNLCTIAATVAAYPLAIHHLAVTL